MEIDRTPSRTEQQLRRFIQIADLHPLTVLRFWAGLPSSRKTLAKIRTCEPQLRAQGLL